MKYSCSIVYITDLCMLYMPSRMPPPPPQKKKKKKKKKKMGYICTTHILVQLHQPPVKQCMDYKFLLYVYSALYGLVTSYLADLLTL